MITRSATARYEGLGKEGKGRITTQSGALSEQGYSFGTRFENGPGTNPAELVAAAHAACFTMALSYALAKEGLTAGSLETVARVKLDQQGEGFAVTRSDLSLTGKVEGIEEPRFRALAEDAKANCPISKLLKAEMNLEIRFDG